MYIILHKDKQTTKLRFEDNRCCSKAILKKYLRQVKISANFPATLS